MSSAQPDESAQASRMLDRARALFNPTLRTTALFVLLTGFAVLAGASMHVSSRQVHYCLRVLASQHALPGGEATLRLTIYRPDSLIQIRGQAEILLHTVEGEWESLGSIRLSSDTMQPFFFSIPERASEEQRLRIIVREEAADSDTRTSEFAIPLRERPDWLGEGPIPSYFNPDGSRRESTLHEELSGFQRIRVEPAAQLELSLVAEGGAHVRFLENRFFVRLADARHAPLANRHVLVDLGADGDGQRLSLRTDVHGLAEFRATPQEAAIWQIEAQADQEQRMSITYNSFPSWDGLLLSLTPLFVGLGDGLLLDLDLNLRTPTWNYDIIVDGAWVDSAILSTDQRRHRVRPPRGRWSPAEEDLHLLLVQAYASPFSTHSQRSIRGALVHSPELDANQALRAFMQKLIEQGVERPYLTALVDLSLPSPRASQPELERLLSYLIGRIRPPYQAQRLVVDDAREQQEKLDAVVSRFKQRASLLLVVGMLTMLAWIVGRVLISSWQVKRRTAQVLWELDDEEALPAERLSYGAGLNLGLGGMLMLLFATLTLASFCVGLIWLLTNL